MDRLLRDIRFAIRALRSSPAFSLAAVGTLALGIGGTTAVFSLVSGIILEPLNYPEPEQLVLLNESAPVFGDRYPFVPVSANHFETWRDEAESFTSMAAMRWRTMALTDFGEPVELGAAGVSADFFRTLGTTPRMGRDFTAEDDQPGADGVVIITNRLWRGRLGASPSILGQTLHLDGQTYEVIGVLSPDFRWPRAKLIDNFADDVPTVDVFKPIAFRNKPIQGEHNYNAIGRLRPGVSPRQAVAELNVIQAAISKQIGGGFELEAHVRPLRETLTGKTRAGLLLALAAVGAVLLIACVNLANLLLVRGSIRRREMAIRTALGATGQHLLRQAFIESLCLASAGGLIGVAVAHYVVGVFVRYGPLSLPRLDEVSVDGEVFAFAAAVTLICALVFGLVPAWRTAQTNPREALQGGRGAGRDGADGHRLRSIFVGAEVGLSTALLVAAGLLVHSFVRVMARDTGLKGHNVAAVEVSLPRAGYNAERRLATWAFIVARLERLPSVLGVAAINQLPFTREQGVNAIMAKDAPPVPKTEWPMTNNRYVSPGYFQAVGLGFLSGRSFRDDEREECPVVISQSIAEIFWPGQDPVGREIRSYRGNKTPLRVIGVVRNVPVASLERDSDRIVYHPWWENPRNAMALVVRTGMDPDGLAGTIRKAVWEVEPAVPVPDPKTLARLATDSVSGRRFDLALVSLFAVTALLLACLGVYGLLSYSVAQRTGEIGIRLALGARAFQVGVHVLHNGMRPVVVGLGIGLATALGLTRLLESMLFEVSALDTATFLVVPAILAAAALAACLIPALRAARIQPMTALRYE
ncbi:MAG: ABC transporter permease [bacterium]|nr:ABC transporter permease [bacterium]